jgi:hypothetical protein
VTTKCQTDNDRKKIASVASPNQSVQHEKKKSQPTRSQKDLRLICTSIKLLFDITYLTTVTRKLWLQNG